jgi:hypothetical protein
LFNVSLDNESLSDKLYDICSFLRSFEIDSEMTISWGREEVRREGRNPQSINPPIITILKIKPFVSQKDIQFKTTMFVSRKRQ